MRMKISLSLVMLCYIVRCVKEEEEKRRDIYLNFG